jgi:hypothetical protein
LSIGLLIVVLQLSALRSDRVEGVPYSFGLSVGTFGTLLFFFVQLTFISCAAALAYYNHSEVEGALRTLKREIKKLERDLNQRVRQLAAPARGNLTPEKRSVQIKALIAAMNVIETEYRQIAAEYRGANLLSQKNAMASTGVGLDEPPLRVPMDRFMAALAEGEASAFAPIGSGQGSVPEARSASIGELTAVATQASDGGDQA